MVSNGSTFHAHHVVLYDVVDLHHERVGHRLENHMRVLYPGGALILGT